MIRIVLLGRTGNHLFQYALGRVLARKHGVPLILDGSWFNAVGWAEVSNFLRLPIQANVVRRCSLGARALLRSTGKHYWEYRGVPVLKESTNDQSFNPCFLDAPADCVLFGYFQTQRYFECMADELRAELRKLLSDHVQLNDTYKAQLNECCSVAIHVRRKDYLQHSAFDVIDSNYYRRNMDHLRATLPDPRFFVFSDEPDWCRSEFREHDTQVVDSGNAGKNPLHDLFLMSLTSHHLIANSTYSWWAAWLGKKANQQVIMPERWYAHGVIAPIEEKKWW